MIHLGCFGLVSCLINNYLPIYLTLPLTVKQEYSLFLYHWNNNGSWLARKAATPHTRQTVQWWQALAVLSTVTVAKGWLIESVGKFALDSMAFGTDHEIF